MSNIADLILKDSANVDTTFTAAAGSAGDNSPALWRNLLTNVPVAFDPSFTMSGRWNKAKDARHVEVKCVLPYYALSTDSGLYQPVSKALFSGSFVLPQNQPAYSPANIAWFVGSFLNNSTVKSQIASGFAFT
jgi:hypothetical protein